MPSVKEELEELRQRNLTKKNAESLKDAGPLSTPEAEENAIKTERAKIKVGVYSKEALTNLEKGGSAVDQTLDFRIKTGAAKKSDIEKQKEAAQNLHSFKMTTSGDTTPVLVEDDDDDVPELEEVEDVPALEEVPDLEEAAPDLPAGVDPTVMSQGVDESRINRAERKSRRMMEKLGMKKVAGVTQCTIKMGGRQGIFTIAKPDVFEKNGSYVVFGEARQGGGGLPGAANATAAASMQEQQAQAVQKLAAQASGDEDAVPQIEEVEEEDIDESGLNGKDVELVMGQAGCSRAKAVKALKSNDGDLVNAIMSLTA